MRATGASQQILANEIATRSADPNFFAGLSYLPNPDHVLQRLGRSQEVYSQILADAHVIGELRSVRAGLLSFEHKLLRGGDTPADAHAKELCQWVLNRMPAPGMQWGDVWWTMAQAVFRGYAVHEVVWGWIGGALLPVRLLDRENTRFLFSPENDLRLKTRAKPVEGEELGPYKWLVTRHMASQTNPYGQALLSSCFWPWTFKASGFRYFVKFCEKYGVPKAVGEYPEGTPETEQNRLADALASMVEDSVAAIPQGGSVRLLESSHSGEIVHERLLAFCNGEMSKALTSQTLATEIRGGGSRAAAQVHRAREQNVQTADRSIIEATVNQLFAWITELNVPAANPPTFHFFEEAEARKEWLEVLDKSRGFIQVPAAFAHERLQIPQPVDDEDVLPSRGAPATRDYTRHGAHLNPTSWTYPGAHRDFGDFSRNSFDFASPSAELDDLIAELPAGVRELLDGCETLVEFRDGLEDQFDNMSTQKLGDFMALALASGYLEGAEDADS